MKTLQIWHLMSDKYVHLTQVTDDTTITYYTDGKLEGKRNRKIN